MKFSCNQKELQQNLNDAARIAGRKTTLPVTQNALLEAQGGMLKITATNLEQTLSLWLKAAVEEEGATTVPARVLSDFVASMDQDSRVDFEIGEGESVLNVSCRRSTANVNTTEPSNFPAAKSVSKDGGKEPVALEINPQGFRTCISRVAPAAADEESRPVLTGVNMKISGRQVTMAAADGFRLSVDRTELEQEAPEPLDVIIPANTMREMERLTSGNGAKTTLLLGQDTQNVMLRTEHPDGERAELTTQLLQGTFPDYEQLIPKEYATRAVLDTGRTSRAIRTSAIFAKESSNLIRLHIGQEEPSEKGPCLTITARSEEIAGGSDEIDIAHLEGEPNKIAFNFRYLTELMHSMDSEQMSIEVTSPSSPGVFRMMGNDDFTTVIMPMFVQW